MRIRLIPLFVLSALATGTILPVAFAYAGSVLEAYKYAWSDEVGYVNFESVIVDDETLSGYAWSTNAGWIKFNPEQGGVTNDGSGDLTGFAWGEHLGWIDFEDVAIDPDTGEFSGTATGELVGTLTFDCAYCDVRTDWAPSEDVQAAGGGNPRRPADPEPTEEPVPVEPSEPVVVAPVPEPETEPEPAIPPVSEPEPDEVVGEPFPVETERPVAEPVDDAYVETHNEELTLRTDQYGEYVQDGTVGEIIVEVPRETLDAWTTFSIVELLSDAISIEMLLVEWTDLVGSVVYEVTARDQDGNPVHTFASPLTITLPIPDELIGQENLGVYWLNETNRAWALIPDARFSEDHVSFEVNHLTKFGIFLRDDGQPPEQVIPIVSDVSGGMSPMLVWGGGAALLAAAGAARWLILGKRRKRARGDL